MERRKEIIEIVKSMYAQGEKETIPEQILVLIYEIGDLAKCIANMIWYPKDTLLYKAEAKKAIADIITQLRITCKYLGISYEEMEKLGFLALKEKAEEFRKIGLKKSIKLKRRTENQHWNSRNVSKSHTRTNVSHKGYENQQIILGKCSMVVVSSAV